MLPPPRSPVHAVRPNFVMLFWNDFRCINLVRFTIFGRVP